MLPEKQIIVNKPSVTGPVYSSHYFPYSIVTVVIGEYNADILSELPRISLDRRWDANVNVILMHLISVH